MPENPGAMVDRLDLDAFVDLVFLLDPGGRFRVASSSAEQILGAKPAELVGRSLEEFLAEPYRPALAQLTLALQQERLPEPHECELRRGEERVPVELSLRALREDGEIVAFQGTLREVWRRRKKSDQLLETKRRFAVLNEIGRVMQGASQRDALWSSLLPPLLDLIRYDDAAVYLIDGERQLRRGSLHGERRLFPVSLNADGGRDALLNEAYFTRPRLLDSDSAVSRIGVLENLRARGRRSSMLMPMVSGGRLQGVLVLASREHRPLDGGLRALLPLLGAQLAQLREARTLQEQVRDLGLRFEDLSEGSADHIWEIDRMGCYVYNSAGVSLLLGYSQADMRGRQILDFVHEEDAETVETALLEAIEAKQPISGMVCRLVSTENKPIFVETRAFPIIDARGELSGFRGVDRNISDWFESKRIMEETLIGTCEALGRMVELRDPYTKGHSVRVADLAVFLGGELGRSPYELQGLRLMGLLHDIGKVGIPTEILSKPGRLSPEEMDLMRQHPSMSHEILKDISFPWPVADVALHHHERLDGSGYPDGLTGEQIIWQVRLLTVADLLEAMATDRPYRPGLGLDRALEELQINRGIVYDPEIVDLVARLAEEGSLQPYLEHEPQVDAPQPGGELDTETVVGIIEEELGRKPEAELLGLPEG